MWSEAIRFLAGAAWNALGVVPVVRWRPGGTGGPPSLRASWWAFGCACRARSSFAHRQMCGVFFPTRGKEPKGDRWQPNRDSTMAAPGPLLAWLGGGASCCARLIASSRGRHEGTWGVMSLVRWRPGGTGAALAVRVLVGFWLHRAVQGSLPAARAWRLFFPSRGKEPKGDRWQPN